MFSDPTKIIQSLGRFQIVTVSQYSCFGDFGLTILLLSTFMVGDPLLTTCIE